MRKIGRFFKKTFRFFGIFLCIMLDGLLISYCMLPLEEAGGLGMPSMLGLLLWAVFGVIAVKLSPLFSVLLTYVFYLVMFWVRRPADDQWGALFVYGALVVAAYFLIRKKLRETSMRDIIFPERKPEKVPREAPRGKARAADTEEDLYEQRQREGRHPGGSCCEYLREFDLGYYDNGMSQKCMLLDSQMTADEARRRCYHSKNYERCPIRRRQTEGTAPARGAGKGKSPTGSCCRYLKEYPSGYYDYYSHRCEVTETEMPENTARQNCYFSADYKNCPVWQKHH